MDDKLGAMGGRVTVYLFAIALATHICYLCQYARTPFFWVPELDSLYDDLAARAIVAGHASHEAFFRAPLYSYFLAAVYKLFGHSYWAARLVQAVVGSLSVALVYRLGTRVFRPSTAVIAAAAMAFYGPLIFANGELHTPVLEVFLDLGFLNVVVVAEEFRRINPRLSVGLWCAAGLVLGLSAITRPTILVVIPVVVWWIIQPITRRPGTSLPPTPSPLQGKGELEVRRSASLATAAVALFLFGAALFPALVTVRNARASGDPVFIASQGGINLFLGNRPEADGFTPSTPRRYRFDGPYEDSVALYGRKAAEEAEGRPLTASQAQAYWVKQSLEWWRHDPKAAIRLTLKKCALAWTHQEIRNNTAYNFVRQELAPFLRICLVGFWLAGPLGLLGMALGWRTDAAVRKLAAFTLIYIAGFVPFFMADRYRLPIVPLLLLHSAYAVVSIAEHAEKRQWRSVAAGIAALIPFAVLVNVDWVRTETPSTWALDHWSAGNRYVKMGKLPEAEAQFQKALKLDPRNGDIWTGLGETLYDEGRSGDAAVCFRNAALTGQDVGRAEYNEALCAEQAGDIATASRLLQFVVNLDPNYELAQHELADVNRRHACAASRPETPLTSRRAPSQSHR